MTVATLAPRAIAPAGAVDIAGPATALSDACLRYGGPVGARTSAAIDRKVARRSVYAVWVVAIIAIAVVAVVGIMAYVAVVCIRRGGSYNGGLSIRTNGWKVWEYRLTFQCTR